MFDSPRKSLFALAAGLLLASVLAACSEDLGSGAACPALCPDSNVEMLDIELFPIVLDTTLVGLPPLGTAGRLLVASRGDTLLTYGVVRYDVLPQRWRPSTTDTSTVPITNLTGARMRFLTDTLQELVEGPITIELYDVDTTAADTSHAAIAALVRPDRLIGSVALPEDTTRDTIRVPISNAVLLAKIQAQARLRVAVAVRPSVGESAQLQMIGLASSTDASVITFIPVGEDNVEGAEITIQPRSTTPAASPAAAAQLADYTAVAIGSPTPPSTQLGVGGMPGRRTYLRFELPAEILDSATIIRAQLVLTQVPVARSVAPDDTIGVYPYFVTAGAAVTDLERAASLIAAGSVLGLDSLELVPSGSGPRTLEVVRLVRAWQGQDPEEVPHALVLRTGIEDFQPIEIRFASTEAEAALRPRLRLVYIPRTNPGLP